MHLTLEFGGGLELLLEKSTKVHKVDVQPRDGEDKATMKGLLSWVKSNLIKERPEMFIKDDSVRPGVLVLINDCDWELCGGLDAELEDKDVVVFISTLHVYVANTAVSDELDNLDRQRSSIEERKDAVKEEENDLL